MHKQEQRRDPAEHQTLEPKPHGKKKNTPEQENELKPS